MSPSLGRLTRSTLQGDRRFSGSSDEGVESVESQSKTAIPIEVDGEHEWIPVAFTGDAGYIVGGDGNKIRCWRVNDGKEVEQPVDAGNVVRSIAASRDGAWIVSGTVRGKVAVWNTESHKRVSEFEGHATWVCAVDISPDSTRIATGSDDKTLCVWSRSTGEQLLGPLKHSHGVAAVKFSPDGQFIATATWWRESVRMYDSRDGRLLFDSPIRVGSPYNQSLAWVSDSKQLFALSRDGGIHCLDVPTGRIVSAWAIHSDDNPRCIALGSNGTFIAVSANSSVSFWDTATHKQMDPLIRHQNDVVYMAISADDDLVISAEEKIILRKLPDILPSSYFDDTRKGIYLLAEGRLEGIIQHFRMQGQYSSETIASLKQAIQALRNEAHQRADGLNQTIRSLRAEISKSNRTIANHEKTVQTLRTELTDSRQKVDSITEILCVHRQKYMCESLYADGHVMDAAQLVLEIVRTATDDVKADATIMDWISGEFCLHQPDETPDETVQSLLSAYKHKCAVALESIGDNGSKVADHNEELRAYSIALSLSPPSPNGLLFKWARLMLLRGSPNETLDAATKFMLPTFVIYSAICEILAMDGRITEAVGFFQHMQRELAPDTCVDSEQGQWELSFRQQCRKILEELSEVAMGSQNYSKAAEYFSTMLSLDPEDCADILIKRSRARSAMESWEDALRDADEVVKLDPSSYRGYEERHAVLHGARRYTEAVSAFDKMLSIIKKSSDENIHELSSHFHDARPTIRRLVAVAVSHLPRALIDTTTGQLCDRTQLAEAFEALPIFNELTSSMTTRVDKARIWSEVMGFYRYVMLSHKWEDGEPLFRKVERLTVHKLEVSPTNMKLQSFCMLVRSLGFRWAWSDTCCIDRDNNVVLQESIVAMFSWYHDSSLTLVYLRDVPSESQEPGGLQGSIWNTRVWTYQEYLAAKRVQFYTGDWKPYLRLTLENHKESPTIISEMERASQVSAEQAAALQPGLDRVREKLSLASRRQTTHVEDIAYSLLGIFNVAMPVIYGEGTRAVGRLLEHVLTGSGDVTILAWTGIANDYNSCLPKDLTVYDEVVPPHIPPLMEMTEMDQRVTELRSSAADLSLSMTLHDRLVHLPPPTLVSSRLRLPGIVSRVTQIAHVSQPEPESQLHILRVETAICGDMEIKTKSDLIAMKRLYVVHPWGRVLLDQEFSREVADSEVDKAIQALRILARLRQPFGALLFEQVSRTEYKRAAVDSLIMTQICEDIPLSDLIGNIHIIDVQ